MKTTLVRINDRKHVVEIGTTGKPQRKHKKVSEASMRRINALVRKSNFSFFPGKGTTNWIRGS